MSAHPSVPSFLADESCDLAIVRAIRQAGFDVHLVAEDDPGATDAAVLGMAHRTGRVVLTEDRDFGFLVWAARARNEGVIYLRYPHGARHVIARSVVDFIERHRKSLRGHFVVVEPGRIRIRRAPP